MEKDVWLSNPTSADFAGLLSMARTAFSDTFAVLYEPTPFAAFLDESYGIDGRMQRDLADPTIEWRIAVGQSGIVGYAKLTPLRAPAPVPLLGAMELQQLYVLRRWHGTGVAAQLMEWALEAASAARAPEVYLTVFDHNERAKRFYARYGFSEVGRCTFQLGDRIDDDRIWRRVLCGNIEAIGESRSALHNSADA